MTSLDPALICNQNRNENQSLRSSANLVSIIMKWRFAIGAGVSPVLSVSFVLVVITLIRPHETTLHDRPQIGRQPLTGQLPSTSRPVKWVTFGRKLVQFTIRIHCCAVEMFAVVKSGQTFCKFKRKKAILALNSFVSPYLLLFTLHLISPKHALSAIFNWHNKWIHL